MNHSRYNVLIACEESQATTLAFRERGFNAFSCDIQAPSGQHQEWHIKGDATRLLDTPVTFRTMDGKHHRLVRWHLLIAHPPCTYICQISQIQMFAGGKINKQRYVKMVDACNFFMTFLKSSIELICVENPVPLKIAPIPTPTTYIEPFWFSSKFRKKTCLWLKNLPPLMPTYIWPNPVPYVQASARKKRKIQGIATTQKQRSKTFPEVAQQFAIQYGDYMIDYYNNKKKISSTH